MNCNNNLLKSVKRIHIWLRPTKVNWLSLLYQQKNQDSIHQFQLIPNDNEKKAKKKIIFFIARFIKLIFRIQKSLWPKYFITFYIKKLINKVIFKKNSQEYLFSKFNLKNKFCCHQLSNYGVISDKKFSLGKSCNFFFS